MLASDIREVLVHGRLLLVDGKLVRHSFHSADLTVPGRLTAADWAEHYFTSASWPEDSGMVLGRQFGGNVEIVFTGKMRTKAAGPPDAPEIEDEFYCESLDHQLLDRELLAEMYAIEATEVVASSLAPPIPAGIYYSREYSNFYNADTAGGMGHEFYHSWSSRQAEFPQSRAEAKRVRNC